MIDRFSLRKGLAYNVSSCFLAVFFFSSCRLWTLMLGVLSAYTLCGPYSLAFLIIPLFRVFCIFNKSIIRMILKYTNDVSSSLPLIIHQIATMVNNVIGLSSHCCCYRHPSQWDDDMLVVSYFTVVSSCIAICLDEP